MKHLLDQHTHNIFRFSDKSLLYYIPALNKSFWKDVDSGEYENSVQNKISIAEHERLGTFILIETVYRNEFILTGAL